MNWLFAIALMSVPLVVGEMMKKQLKDLPPEFSRKFVHRWCPSTPVMALRCFRSNLSPRLRPSHSSRRLAGTGRR